MEFTTFLFYAFSFVLVMASVCVVTFRNPVHSALFLVLAFFTAAGIWMLLQAEFLAIALVLVYVGAVMVLFLFVVMMLDIDLTHLRRDFWTYVPMASVIGGGIILEMSLVMVHGFMGIKKSVTTGLPEEANTHALGKLIYTDYIYAFEVAGAILLVAIIAAVALTLRGRKDSKAQNPAEQVRVRREDRLRLISMPAEPDLPAKSGE